VLLAPDVPAVLLEMGFITNKDDEHGLNDADQRRKLMDGVTEAIDAYFAQELRFALR
jgi:N-acetylmuramoyl-L-alanine amidase